jgi:hypothetical protein
MSIQQQEQTDESVILPFVKDTHFEEILDDVNEDLYDLETRLIAPFDQPEYPLLLICGPQRSGTTLMLQLLIACFRIGYINNLMARFWKVPYIGALLARDLRRRQVPLVPDFSSEFGATYGYDGPHEFGFFWQHWFPYNETHQTSTEDLEKLDAARFRKELAAIESTFNLPLAFKNPIVLTLNMDTLATLLPKAIFVICRRDPVYVAQSTLLSRLRKSGSKEQWLSIKPREYPQLKELPYLEQIAGQIFYTEKRVNESLETIASHRFVTVAYQDLCANPMYEMNRIQELVRGKGYSLTPTGFQAPPLQRTDTRKLDVDEFQKLQASCRKFWQTDME